MATTNAPSLRERQADLTRNAILDALAATIGERGLHDFSVQEIADRAGVSHRTVYRHFANREALLDGLAEKLDALFEERKLPLVPEGAESVGERIGDAFDVFAQHPDLVRAVAVGSLATGGQPRSRRTRDRAIRDAVEEEARGLPGDERRRVAAVVRYLANSLAWVVLTEQLGLGKEDATRAVSWAVETLLADIQRRASSAGREG